MDIGAAFRRCLEDLDIPGARALWAETYPGMPQPESDSDILKSMHLARTMTNTLDLKHRAYSHRWLLDNGLPTGLPDDLRPKAEQICPKIVEGVAVSSLVKMPHSQLIRKVMNNAIEECYADGDTDPVVVKSVMMERRAKEKKKLMIEPPSRDFLLSVWGNVQD